MASQDSSSTAALQQPAVVVAKTLATILLFAAAFFVVQRLTFTLRFPPFQRTAIWTPGALTFTALLLTPPRHWWIYYVGLCAGVYAAFNSDVYIPAGQALIAAQFHFPAVALSAWTIRRIGTQPLFGSVVSLLVFVPIAIFVVSTITTAPVDIARFARGEVDVWGVAVRSTLGISLGTLIATPAFTLAVAHGREWLRSLSWRRLGEIVLLGSGLVAVVHLSFDNPPGGESMVALLYAPLPLLLWAALRFELAGATWALLAVAFQSAWAAIHGRGPFSSGDPAVNVLQLQLFLLAIALPLMFLAVVVQERRSAYVALNLSDQEIRRQFAQLAGIYNTAPIGLAFINTDLQFLRVNEYLAETNGRPADDHIGRSIREVVPQVADKIEAIHRHVIETGKPVVDVEVRAVTASQPGIERDWLASYYPVRDVMGHLLGVNIVVQEITERRRIEEARQELAHASRLAIVGELTASIAHEINQPLGAILSNTDAAEMLLESLPSSLNEVREILNDIRNDDLRATEVIRRLRRLLQQREIQFQPVDLKELIVEVVRLVRTESERRGVTVRQELSDALPPISGDLVHLQQVFLNIFINGMESMADIQGERLLAIRAIAIDNDTVEVTVSDRGFGIPEDRMPELFDAFFSTKQEGMGLGLSISRSIVEAHSGRIGAKNNASGGATFWISLPANREHVAPERPHIGSAPVVT